MKERGRRPAFGALCMAVLASLALAGSAQAAITGSHVTQPKDPRYLVYNDDNPNTFAIKGTTSGGNPATDKVDLLCFYGTTHVAVATNVPLGPSGGFSVPAADLSKIDYLLCRLRAVPAGTVPANLAPFRGPVLGGDHRQNYTVSTGPNAGTLTDLYVWAQQRAGAFDYDSLGSCGIDDSYLFDSTLDLTAVVFYCNGWLERYENLANSAASTRSELRIDGANAYPVDAASDINDAATPGFPALRWSLKVNPITGRTVIHDSELLVKCPDPTYPPTPASCPKFVSTGVRDNRTIVQDHAGHLATITDVFRTTNGRAHRLDLLWQNDQRFQPEGGGGDSTTVAYRFPGQGHYSTHAIGDTVKLPKRAARRILIKQQGAPDGDTSSGRGAIVYDRRALSATFNDITTNRNNFYLHQRVRVPKHRSATVRFAYAQAFTQKLVKSLARFSLRRFAR